MLKYLGIYFTFLIALVVVDRAVRRERGRRDDEQARDHRADFGQPVDHGHLMGRWIATRP